MCTPFSGEDLTRHHIPGLLLGPNAKPKQWSFELMSAPEVDALTLAQYLEGIESLQKTEGWKIHQDMERLSRSFYIFEANYHELSKGLFLDYSQFLILFDVRNGKEMEAFLIEVTRLFHNFVAGAKTLVDHTRNIATQLYENTHFWQVYQSEVDRCFTSNPVIQFVHGLRNYILHKDLPLTSASLSSSFETAVRINIVILREWDRWKPVAREYLETCADNEKIENIASTYYKAILEFHEWFFNNQKKLHEQAFSETNALRQRLVASKWHYDPTT
jgi:hypothetical protein